MYLNNSFQPLIPRRGTDQMICRRLTFFTALALLAPRLPSVGTAPYGGTAPYEGTAPYGETARVACESKESNDWQRRRSVGKKSEDYVRTGVRSRYRRWRERE